MPQKMPMRFTADHRDWKAAMREYAARLWNEDAGRAAELAYLDRILERLENLEALATAGILIVAVLFVIWFL